MIPFSGEEEYSDIDHSTLGLNYQDRIDRAKIAYQHVKRWTKNSDDPDRDAEVNKARNRRTDHLATHNYVKNLRQKKIQEKQDYRNANADKNAGYHELHDDIIRDQIRRKDVRTERYEKEQGHHYAEVRGNNNSRRQPAMYFEERPVVAEKAEGSYQVPPARHENK